MTEYTSIRVKQKLKDEAQEYKRDDETWGEYLIRCGENPPPVQELVPAEEMQIDKAQLARLTADEVEERLR